MLIYALRFTIMIVNQGFWSEGENSITSFCAGFADIREIRANTVFWRHNSWSMYF